MRPSTIDSPPVQRICSSKSGTGSVRTTYEPNAVEVPMQTLLSDAYNDERRRLIGKSASLELRPGAVGGRAGRVLTGKPMDLARLRASGAFGGNYHHCLARGKALNFPPP